ncbi:MAG: hypothetical protein ACOZQL_40200 [Myxococcota bacterium]
MHKRMMWGVVTAMIVVCRAEAQVSEPPPNYCAGVEDFSALQPDVFVTGTGSIIVSHVEAAPQRASVGGGTEYWCTCSGGSGSCYVKMTGTTASCVSMSCTQCTLNSRQIGKGSTVKLQDVACGAAAVDPAALAQRVKEVQAFRAANRIPDPIVSADRHEAYAPAGYDLILERIGGRELIYLVPEGTSTRGAVGPSTSGPAPVQAAIGKPRVKCSCSGTGSCSFTGDNVCVPDSTCSGERGCSVTVKGAQTLTEDFLGTSTVTSTTAR